MLNWLKRIATPDSREQLVENEKQIERLTGRLEAYNKTANELAGGFAPASGEQSVENQAQTRPHDQTPPAEEKVERLVSRPRGTPNAPAGTFTQTLSSQSRVRRGAPARRRSPRTSPSRPARQAKARFLWSTPIRKVRSASGGGRARMIR
jgi:hypothetical protein